MSSQKRVFKDLFIWKNRILYGVLRIIIYVVSSLIRYSVDRLNTICYNERR